MSKENQQKNKLISKKYLSYLFPTLLMAFSTQMNIIVDKVIVGNFMDPVHMAAVNVCMPVAQFIFTLAIIIGVGTTANVSREIGAQNKTKANQFYTASIVISLTVGILFVIIFSIFSTETINLLTKDVSIFSLSQTYFQTFLYSTPFILLAVAFQNIARSDGKPKLSMISVLIGNFINLILDFLFVGPCGFGLQGAALATVTGNTVTAGIVFLGYIKHSKRSLHLVKIQYLPKILNIISTGIPAGLGTGLITIKIAVINREISEIAGKSGLVTFTVLLTCLSLMSMFTAGVNQSMMPIVSEFYGQKDIEGVKLTLKKAFLYLIVMIGIIIVFLEIFPQIVIFIHGITEPDIISSTIHAIRLYAVSLLGVGITFQMIYYFTAIGKKAKANILSIVEGFAVVVPLCYILPEYFNIDGIWYALIAAEIVAVLLIAVFCKGKISNLYTSIQ